MRCISVCPVFCVLLRGEPTQHALSTTSISGSATKRVGMFTEHFLCCGLQIQVLPSCLCHEQSQMKLAQCKYTLNTKIHSEILQRAQLNKVD